MRYDMKYDMRYDSRYDIRYDIKYVVWMRKMGKMNLGDLVSRDLALFRFKYITQSGLVACCFDAQPVVTLVTSTTSRD